MQSSTIPSFCPTPLRLQNLSTCLSLFSRLDQTTFWELIRLLGLLESLAFLLPLGSFEKRPLQREVRAKAQDPSDMNQLVRLGPGFTTAVQAWTV